MTSTTSVHKEDQLQRPNVYNSKLPRQEEMERDRVSYLEEIRSKLSSAVMENDIEKCSEWTINLHKYIICYGFAFSREEHIFYIKLLYGLLTTQHVDPLILDKLAKVLYALIKKKFLIPRTQLTLDWKPLFELYHYWDNSSVSMRGLLKPQSGFKDQLRTLIKYCRGYFSDEATGEMLERWKPMLCPADRSMTHAVKYCSLFLPTTNGIPADKSWRLWLPMFQSFWQSWGNSPAWEVDLFRLYSRLAVHRVGQVDWEPHLAEFFTRIMNSFNLPVTFGGSGLVIKHGMSGSSCTGAVSKWIVYTLGPGSTSMSHLSKMLRAIRSYYHPANLNNSSEQLHGFISSLCSNFINRLHVERHINKFETKIPVEKRLRDSDVDEFVEAVTPIAWLVLYNSYEEEARTMFSSLALISPGTIIPRLLNTLSTAADILTEPHRFHVCIQAVSAIAGPLVRHFPGRAIQLLNSLLPAIDVNDIWRSTDIFICMSDLLEMMAVSSTIPAFTNQHHEDVEINFNFEDFVAEFISKCFNLIENSKRINVRNDAGNNEDYLNDEEIAADAAINDTFLRMCINASPEIMSGILSRLKSYVSGRIVEPTVAGGILACMCRSVVMCDPVSGLAVFIPMLVSTITSRMRERQVDSNKLDEELQFNLQLLGEVLNCQTGVFRSRGEHILPWVQDISAVLDTTLQLTQKDEYELAHSVISSLLSWLCRARLLETGPRIHNVEGGWGALQSLDSVDMEWYVPGDQEMRTVHALLERYLLPVLDTLAQYAEGKISLDKEVLTRHLRLVLKILNSVSEQLEPEKSGEFSSVLSQSKQWLESRNIKVGGENVRQAVKNLMCSLQDKLIQDRSDDADSFTGIIYIYDVLLFTYGFDEDELGDHIDEHKREKQHRADQLHRNKKHLPGVHLDRVLLQWETHLWLKNLLVMETMPVDMMNHVMTLCLHRYSEVRMAAQELMLKILARLGKVSHPMILPQILECLKQDEDRGRDGDTSLDIEEVESKLKGALYLIYSEKHMFFYSWETASQLWPALVTCQQSDKQSVDDLLKDISIKANRYYQDYILYTLPLSSTSIDQSLVDLVRNNTNVTGVKNHKETVLGKNEAMKQLVHYQQLETNLITLLNSNTLHWRHQEMGVGMLLSMITYDHTPTLASTQLWLSLLISDQRTLRLMAYQALEGILKLSKIPSNKVPLSELVPGHETVEVSKPGVREDNQCLQYRGQMSEAELRSYWSKPFIVKSHVGYYTWPARACHQDTARLIHTSQDFALQPDSVREMISQFFMDETKMNTFVEFNSLEHEKGQDFFSTDRGLFLSFLLEIVGPRLTSMFQPHIERLVSSPEESQQRAAAEMVYGLVRGSRFWEWESAEQMWSWLLPVFQQVLNNVTSETQSDWDICFSGASNKSDPNRLRWLYELLITPENLVSQGSFKESSYLLFVSKCLSMNWRVQELYCRTYNILRDHWDHPYNNVRHQISMTLATLTNLDIPWAGAETGNVGEGFPTKKLFIDEVTPLLSLNCPNPEFKSASSTRSMSPATSLDTSHSSTEDVSMETVEDEETKRGKRILEMVSLWVCHSIRLSSGTLDPILYQLLPYMCQYIGTESDQDVSQSCLKALSYLSVCILPHHALAPCLHMSQRCITSNSYKTKLSTLEFLQTAVFTNFSSFVANNELRSGVIQLTTSLLSDSHITVRQKAAKILGGLLHSGFVSDDVLTELLTDLRGKVRHKMTRQRGRKFKKDSTTTSDTTAETGSSNTDKIVTLHSGVLGLCAFVEAFPHDVPDFVPPILMELSTHLNDPQPIPLTIKKTLQEFKRTHQDNWQEHKTKFSEDQLYVMTDLLVSHNYYA